MLELTFRELKNGLRARCDRTTASVLARSANDAANLEMGPANGLRPICDQAGPKEVSTASQSGEVQGSIRPANDAANLVI